MTAEQRAREEAWLMKHLCDDEPGGLMAIGRASLDAMFPYPDTTGMTPEQAGAALTEREARVRHFLDTVAEPTPATLRAPVQPATAGHNPVPAS